MRRCVRGALVGPIHTHTHTHTLMRVHLLVVLYYSTHRASGGGDQVALIIYVDVRETQVKTILQLNLNRVVVCSLYGG